MTTEKMLVVACQKLARSIYEPASLFTACKQMNEQFDMVPDKTINIRLR